MRDNLYKEINHDVVEWYKNPICCQPNNLYMVLIAHNKAVLFVFQLDMNCVSIHYIILIFSHSINVKIKI